jgi:DNA-binding MarR family transcriptional regulator
MEPDLSDAALKALRRILRASDLGNRRVASATGLSPSQLLVLREIGQRRETTPGALAAALQFSQATITSIIDRLEADGYVTRQRSAQDKRQIMLQPSATGARMAENAPDLLHTQFRDGFVSLDPWEQAMILSALERLCILLGAESIDAAPLLDSGAIDRRVTPA